MTSPTTMILMTRRAKRTATSKEELYVPFRIVIFPPCQPCKLTAGDCSLDGGAQSDPNARSSIAKELLSF